jgi:glycosyltransferase involved in cell wall biosynthesis
MRQAHPIMRASEVRISVIMPSYNSGMYIAEALDSALSQRPAPFEVIVQDGGSTDGTLETLRSFGPSVTWQSQPDSGQSQALNRAIARSRGEVVVWLNADDMLTPGALAAAADAFVRAPGAEFVYGDFEVIRENGTTLRHFTSSEYGRRRVFWRGTYIFSGAMFLRRSLLERVGPFDESLHTCMDLDYLLRLDGARWVHIPLPVARFRMNDAAKSNTIRRQFIRESHAVRRRAASNSIVLRFATPLLTLRDAIVLASTPARHSRVWSAARRRRRL